MPPDLKPTRCALCKTEGNATELYAPRLGAADLTPKVFSARRAPDRIHYRIVRCNSCGLLRSDPIAAHEALETLYAMSAFNYADELVNLRATYGRLLARTRRSLSRAEALLELGCGNGFFLEEALAQGFTVVRGVEPSRQAAEQGTDGIRRHIVVGVMRPGLFEPEQFDLVCMFHLLDHLPDPSAVLGQCHALLRPGGMIICVAHDAASLSAKVLGERSPIIDVEHTYLFDQETAAKLFVMHRFEIERLGSLRNRYSLAYMASLLPLPNRVKRPLTGLLRRTALGNVAVTLALGNFHLVGRKSSGPLAA